MSVLIFPDAALATKAAAIVIAGSLLENPYANVGLTYDSSLDGVYHRLRKMTDEGILFFSNHRFYQLCEFVSASEENAVIRKLIGDSLFGKNLPDGERYVVPYYPQMNWAGICTRFENDILEHGGLDLAILVLRPDGSLLYNLAGDELAPITHVEVVGDEKVVSAGMATVMRAKKLVVLALGESVAEACAKSLGGAISNRNPSAYLQLHQNVTFILDEKAASLL